MPDQLPLDTPTDLDRPSPAGAPRWVKISGIVLLALALLVGIMKMTGLAEGHGPGRHGSGQEQETDIEGGQSSR